MPGPGEVAFMAFKKLWMVFGAVIIGSFAVLGYFGREIYRQAPPIPDREDVRCPAPRCGEGQRRKTVGARCLAGRWTVAVDGGGGNDGT